MLNGQLVVQHNGRIIQKPGGSAPPEYHARRQWTLFARAAQTVTASIVAGRLFWRHSTGSERKRKTAKPSKRVFPKSWNCFKLSALCANPIRAT